MDTSVLEERVKKQLQDRNHLIEIEDAQKREKELLQRVAKLEEENRKLSINKQSTQKLKKEFQQASEGLTAVDWFYKANALWDGKKVTDPKKAIEYLTNAIKLQPDYAMAYNNRGIAYTNLRQQQWAIEDFDEAIRLQPDLAMAHCNRGAAYGNIGQYQRAIEDLNEAIRLKPDYAMAYDNRGLAYFNLDQRLRAIEEFNEAIRLKPDLVDAYNHRAVTYLLLGNNNLGCRDAQKACALGDCKALDWAKSKERCH